MEADEGTSREVETTYIEENQEINGWIPQVSENFKPVKGMQFDTLQEAENFYTIYTREAGFSKRKGSTTYVGKGEEKVLASKIFLCAKEGVRAEKKNNSSSIAQKKRKITRVGCEAYIRIKLMPNSRFEVTKFNEAHNHPLASPHKVHLLRSHRQISPLKRSMLDAFRSSNISTARAIDFFGVQSGGYENMGCTERDIRNYERNERQSSKESDAHDFIDILKQEQECNPSFYFAYKLDEENKLTHCFWVDGFCRKSYAHFGDIVVFDTTYDTNEYRLIFAPFTGINHHTQSVLFGAGLIADEKADSFCWLFEKWLESMSEHHPTVFITDQDPAMSLAIARCFPQAHHRFCMWHILKKLSEKVKVRGSWEAFNTKFHEVIWNSENTEEFEMRWTEVISSYSLESNEWLQSLYDIRHQWIPAYSKHIFMAGVRTTQRSESMNAVFDKHVGKKNSLCAFYTHFKMALDKMKHRELELDHSSLYSQPQLSTRMLVERQMAKIYTHGIFDKFQIELHESFNYLTDLKSIEGCLHMFTVKRSGGQKFRDVIFDASEQKAQCTCKKFEYEGIPCRHMLVVFRSKLLEYLPTHYILDRWTINAKNVRVFDSAGVELKENSNDNFHSLDSEMKTVLHRCLHKISTSDRLKAYFHDSLVNIEKQMEMLSIEDDGLSENITQASRTTDIFIRAPNVSKPKGSGSRIKGGKEKAMEQPSKFQRLCHGCGKRGVDHDKRNCPVLREGNMSTIAHTEASNLETSSFNDVTSL